MKYWRLICRYRLRHIILSTTVSKTFRLIRSVTFIFTYKLHEDEWYNRFDFSHTERFCDGFYFTDQQDRHCTYNVTMRRVRATIVAVEKQYVLHNPSVCVCRLKYAACNAYTPYCHLWPDRLYKIFPHYLINGMIFEKKLLNTKCVF